jgi:hypothetical protein
VSREISKFSFQNLPSKLLPKASGMERLAPCDFEQIVCLSKTQKHDGAILRWRSTKEAEPVCAAFANAPRDFDYRETGG